MLPLFPERRDTHGAPSWLNTPWCQGQYLEKLGSAPVSPAACLHLGSPRLSSAIHHHLPRPRGRRPWQGWPLQVLQSVGRPSLAVLLGGTTSTTCPPRVLGAVTPALPSIFLDPLKSHNPVFLWRVGIGTL